MSDFQQFLYVTIKENYVKSSGRSKTDTTLRIVYWAAYDDEEDGYDEHFVIYGKRPKSNNTGILPTSSVRKLSSAALTESSNSGREAGGVLRKFVPYRLICRTIDDVQQFVRTVVSSDHNLAIELHQFYGYTDDSEDWYNIDWKNTPDDSSTELVAFDVEPKTTIDGEQFLDFKCALTKVLQVLVNHEVV